MLTRNEDSTILRYGKADSIRNGALPPRFWTKSDWS